MTPRCSLRSAHSPTWILVSILVRLTASPRECRNMLHPLQIVQPWSNSFFAYASLYFFCISICLFVCLCVCMSVSVGLSISVGLYVCLPGCLPGCSRFCLSVRPSVCPFIRSYVCPVVMPSHPYQKRAASMSRRKFSSNTFSDHMAHLQAFQVCALPSPPLIGFPSLSALPSLPPPLLIIYLQ